MRKAHLFGGFIALSSVFSSCNFVLFMMDDQPQSDVLCGLNVHATWYENVLHVTDIEISVANENSFDIIELQLEALVFNMDNELAEKVTYCADASISAYTAVTYNTSTFMDASKISRVDIRIIKANRVY